MYNKISIRDGLKESWQYFQYGWKHYITHWFVASLILFIPIVISMSVIVVILMGGAYDEGLSSTSGIFISLFVVVIFLISVGIQGIYIKISDDFIEERSSKYGHQFTYVMGKFGKLIVANLICYTPLALVSFFLIKNWLSHLKDIQSFDINEMTMFVLVMTIVLYGLFFMFINHNIVIEDEEPIRAVKISARMVFENIGKLLLLAVMVTLVSSLVGLMTQNWTGIFNFLKTIFNGLFSIYASIVITHLFKQITYQGEEAGLDV